MTREDIDNIISVICQNDEDYEKPIISPAYLKKELETLALEQEPCDDAISRQAAIDAVNIGNLHPGIVEALQSILAELPTVKSQQKTGYCRVCKWWKDSDGAFRRGIGADSQCPINREEVYEGNGYCFLFEPQESEKKE